MNNDTKSNRLAQSASSLGAGILGFGLGLKWGKNLSGFALVIIIVGAIFHISGMYVIQLKNKPERFNTVAKILWVSAWVCLIVVVVLFIYLAIL
jgi:NADH:ubiquinone oxidoreductase subunit 6 (subunit J)